MASHLAKNYNWIGNPIVNNVLQLLKMTSKGFIILPGSCPIDIHRSAAEMIMEHYSLVSPEYTAPPHSKQHPTIVGHNQLSLMFYIVNAG